MTEFQSQPFAGPGELGAAASLFALMGHPLRLHLLRSFGDGARSPRELQRELDLTLGLVAYHVRTLHGGGLLDLVSTRPVRGSVESFYRLSDRGRWARMTLGTALDSADAEPADAPRGAGMRSAVMRQRIVAAERRAEAAAVRAESRQARHHARELRAARASGA